MSEDKQKRIIQEQIQANERIIKAVERKQDGAVKGQAPVNERIKQLQPNERVNPPKTPPKQEKKDK